jgi:hypothetical protein
VPGSRSIPAEVTTGAPPERRTDVLLRQIALLPYDPDKTPGDNPIFDRLTHRDVTRVAAALQKQVTRDFAQIWGVSATVDAFTNLSQVPLGYWPVLLVEDVRDAAGFHTDKDGQPFALVEVGNSWSLTASHETLEMLADPFGSRLVAGPSPKAGQGRVEFLVEVCDPPEAEDFAYTVNDILVSDFYTPSYFDPVHAAGVRYSFTGSITEPRQVLPGGYLSWHNPDDDHWFQLRRFGGAPEFVDLGVLDTSRQSPRAVIDSLTPQTKRLSHLDHEVPALKAAIDKMAVGEQTAEARAQSLDSQIKKLMS